MFSGKINYNSKITFHYSKYQENGKSNIMHDFTKMKGIIYEGVFGNLMLIKST